MDALRLSDADREQALRLLGEHYAVGRLDKDEYDKRSDAIWTARTRADLAPVFADLPAAAPPARRRVAATRRRVPQAPLVVLLVAAAVLLHAPWLLFGLFFLLHPRACGRR